MSWIVSVNFLSGCWTFNRLWRGSLAERMTFCAAVATCFLLGILTSSVHWALPLVAPVLVLGGVEIWSQISDTIARNRRHDELFHLVEETIFGMKSGRSFRSSLGLAQNSLRAGGLKRDVLNWLKVTELKTVSRFDPDFVRVRAELEKVDSTPHQAVLRLEAWRRSLRLESDFRNQCGQVTTQVRLQAGLVGGMYVAILIFGICRGNLTAYPRLALSSLVLFVLGMSLVFTMGRKIKWKF